MSGRQAIDDLIRSSFYDDYENHRLHWIDSELINIVIESSFDQTIHYAQTWYGEKMLLLLGSNEDCTPAFMNEFARKYSLPTCVDVNPPHQFRRYSKWLLKRNMMIQGFTEYEDNYYMVANKHFHHCYSLYRFCSGCG